MSNFYVGQKVVCVKTHSEKVIIKDCIYIIKGIKERVCSCGGVLLDVGIEQYGDHSCPDCGKNDDNIEFTWWFGQQRFKPLSEIDDEALERILKEAIEESKLVEA